MNLIDSILQRMKRDLAPLGGDKKPHPTAFVLSYTEAKVLERFIETHQQRSAPPPPPADAKIVSVEDGLEKWETT